MTDFDEDEKIAALTDKYGFAGQGRLLKIYRIIAGQMGEGEKCEVTYSAKFWCRSLRFRSAIDCRSFLEWLANDQRLFELRSANDQRMISDQSANDWTVRCPKLLKIRARKKPIGNIKGALEVEVHTEVHTEVQKEKEEESIIAIPLQISLSKNLKLSGITSQQIEQWSSAYKYADVKREILKIEAYIQSNPKWGKSKKNWGKTICNWLSRADKPVVDEYDNWQQRAINLNERMEKDKIEIQKLKDKERKERTNDIC